MNIAVIGATGMVGTRAVAEAVARGHKVDAFSRSGKAAEGANGAALDFANTEQVLQIINSHDVTIIAVVNRGPALEAAIDAHKALIAAKPTGRFIVVTGAGSLQDENGKRFVDGEGFPEEYRPEGVAFAKVLDAYLASEGLNWTALSPAFEIAPGERTGSYNVSLDTPAGSYVSAEDFAVALVDEAENPQHAGRRFTVATR